MKPVLTIREENVELPTDTFYRVVQRIMDGANLSAHMNHDFPRHALRFGITVYPPRVYETIRKLKEQHNATCPNS